MNSTAVHPFPPPRRRRRESESQTPLFLLVAAVLASIVAPVAGVQKDANPHRTADPAWDRVVRLSNGRTLVTDGKMALDAALARPASLPTREGGSAKVVEGHLNAKWPDEFALGQLAKGPRSGMYQSPSGVVLNALYVDYLRRTLPSAGVRLRMKGTYEPAIVLLNGTPVGLLMPMVPPR